MSTLTTITWTQAMPADRDEKQFFKDLGTRIAARRRAQAVTQVQLAEALSVSQQTVTAYESRRRRMPISSLPFIARFFGTTIEELMGEQSPSTKKHGPAPLLQQKIERLTRLPKAKQKIVLEVLDGVLSQVSAKRKSCPWNT